MSEKQQLRVELSGRGSMQRGPVAKMSVIPLSKDATSVCGAGAGIGRAATWGRRPWLCLCLGFVLNSVGVLGG